MHHPKVVGLYSGKQETYGHITAFLNRIMIYCSCHSNLSRRLRSCLSNLDVSLLGTTQTPCNVPRRMSSVLACVLASSISTVLTIPGADSNLLLTELSRCTLSSISSLLLIYPSDLLPLLLEPAPLDALWLAYRDLGKKWSNTTWKHGRITTTEAAIMVTFISTTIMICVGIARPMQKEL